MERKTIKPDPVDRRQALTLWLICVLTGGLILFFFLRYRDMILVESQTSPEKAVEKLMEMLRMLAEVLVISAVAFWWYMHRFIGKIRESHCFPPPGTKVFRETEFLEGSEAIARARLLSILTSLITLLVAGLGILMFAAPWFIAR